MTHSCYKEIAKCRFIINARKKMPVNQESTNLTQEDYKKNLLELLAQCNQNNTLVINALLPDLMQYHIEFTNENQQQQNSLPAEVSGNSTKLAQHIYNNSNAVKEWKEFRDTNQTHTINVNNAPIQKSNNKMKQNLQREIIQIIQEASTHKPTLPVVRGGSGGPSWSVGFFCLPWGGNTAGNTRPPPPPPPSVRG